MIREYALDPRALSNWKDFIRLYDGFGVPSGRLISRFPKKWKRLVYDACLQCSDIEKKRIEEKLSAIELKMIVPERDFDGNQPWLNNAEASHAQKPFHAIIAIENPRGHGHIMLADHVEEANPLWKITREECIPKTADELIRCAGMLLEQSEEILLVDQHFNPQNPNYSGPLARFLARACGNGQAPRRVEYHLNAFDRSKSDFEAQCLKIARLFPPYLQVTFVRWKQLDGGQKMHPRYILTERGGFRVEYGLDEGAPGQTTDISILDSGVHAQRWREFQKSTAAFELVDETVVVNVPRK